LKLYKVSNAYRFIFTFAMWIEKKQKQNKINKKERKPLRARQCKIISEWKTGD
jgi:hypothetical protein